MFGFWRPGIFYTAILSWPALLGGTSVAEEAATQPNIAVVGATGGTLSFLSLEPQLEWPIFVRRNDSGAATIEVQIDVTNLVSPSGRLQEVRLQKDAVDFDGKLSLPAAGQVALRLVAAIPEEGVYNGEIGIVIEHKRQPLALKITRTVREVIVAGTTGGALQFTASEPDLIWPIVVRRNDNAAEPRSIGVVSVRWWRRLGSWCADWSCAGTTPSLTRP